MVKTAGSRDHSKHEHTEMSRFWQPLDAGAQQPPAPPAPLRVGKKRARPQTTAGNPQEWFESAKKILGTPAWQQRKHAKAPMETSKGKTKRLMSPSACVNFHPFAETLRDWEEGVPVDCGTNWTRDMIDAAIQQGPHRSAMTPESIALIQEDVAYQVQAGYAQVVDWEVLKENLPPKLKVSPLAVVPQANRRGRMILDLAFPVLRQGKGKGKKRKRVQEVLQESVNDSTVRMAPEAPVKELGNVLKRLL
jgi:hypothetical protein